MVETFDEVAADQAIDMPGGALKLYFEAKGLIPRKDRPLLKGKEEYEPALQYLENHLVSQALNRKIRKWALDRYMDQTPVL